MVKPGEETRVETREFGVELWAKSRKWSHVTKHKLKHMNLCVKLQANLRENHMVIREIAWWSRWIFVINRVLNHMKNTEI